MDVVVAEGIALGRATVPFTGVAVPFTEVFVPFVIVGINTLRSLMHDGCPEKMNPFTEQSSCGFIVLN